MINNVDYSEYSLDELLDVKRNIDPEEAPENYQNLMTELKKRDKEIICRKSLISEKRKNRTEKRKKRLIFFIKIFILDADGWGIYIIRINSMASAKKSF